ncbi:MAG: hypothetical protein FD155_2712 [Bacteroidetes bacterium]|nr:MAG: hypothetical protein FD155_2712 [Bacteroidota bacterium]
MKCEKRVEVKKQVTGIPLVFIVGLFKGKIVFYSSTKRTGLLDVKSFDEPKLHVWRLVQSGIHAGNRVPTEHLIITQRNSSFAVC